MENNLVYIVQLNVILLNVLSKKIERMIDFKQSPM